MITNNLTPTVSADQTTADTAAKIHPWDILKKCMTEGSVCYTTGGVAYDYHWEEGDLVKREIFDVIFDYDVSEAEEEVARRLCVLDDGYEHVFARVAFEDNPHTYYPVILWQEVAK
jgi:hypothetical protein